MLAILDDAVSPALRQELAPWNIRVVLIEPASISPPAVAAGAVARALTTRRPSPGTAPPGSCSC